jgi:ubiquinone/menaquinone biosynthesis C-methylase UbiE
MFKLRHFYRAPNIEEERAFERANIQSKTPRYLETNPFVRFENDVAYKAKVERIAAHLGNLKGFILDIGGNTAGEATILKQQGFNMVVGDINEVALDVSRQRVEKFGLSSPHYVGLDAHNLPFKDNTFSAVTVIEALHHFFNYDQALGEILRILKPGGKLFSLEPNASNPLRRASEVRDRFRGTIEKSFFVRQLERLCAKAGFANAAARAYPSGRSSWKLEEVPAYRRATTRLHGWLSENYPTVFGGLMLEAYKAGELVEQDASDVPLSAVLRSPVNHCELSFDASRRLWVERDGQLGFPDLNGIPVLVAKDAIELNRR